MANPKVLIFKDITAQYAKFINHKDWILKINKLDISKTYNVSNLYDIYNKLVTLMNGVYKIALTKKNANEVFESLVSPSFKFNKTSPRIVDMSGEEVNNMVDGLIGDSSSQIFKFLDFVKTIWRLSFSAIQKSSFELNSDIHKIFESMNECKKLFIDECRRINTL